MSDRGGEGWGKRDGHPGGKGTGSLRDAGEERAGRSGISIPKWREPGEIGNATLRNVFLNRKRTKRRKPLTRREQELGV